MGLGRTLVWDLKVGPAPREFASNLIGSFPVALSPDGKHVALQRVYGGPFDLVEVATGKTVRELSGPYSGYQDSSAFSPDGGLAVATRNDRIRLWDPATGRLRR